MIIKKEIHTEHHILLYYSIIILIICISLFTISCTQKSINKSTNKNVTADAFKETNSVKSTEIPVHDINMYFSQPIMKIRGWDEADEITEK